MANKKLKFILNILLVILLLSGGVVFGITYNKWFSGREETSAKTEFNPDIDPNAVDWVGEITSESTNKQTGGIAIPGYKSIPLRADQLEQQVNFMNPEVNSCYFVLTLIMSDGTELYKSKMISPGKGIYSINLNKTVSKGNYKDCILKYECFRTDKNLTQLNGAEVKVELIFE